MSAWAGVLRAILRHRPVQAAAVLVVVTMAALAVTAAWGLTHAVSAAPLPERAKEDAALFVPFLAVFGVLAAVVAVLIVANLVSGIVISGLRRVGVLKSLGFTPNQVTAIHLGAVELPAVLGALVGAAAGYVIAVALASSSAQGAGTELDVPWWIPLVVATGSVAVVAVAALGPTLRARWLPAVTALTAGSAPASGRGLRAQRWWAGRRLPRSVTLGAGLPFARPGRAALTAASVATGVAVITLSVGVAASVAAFGDLASPHLDGRVIVSAARGQAGAGSSLGAAPLDDPSLAGELTKLPGVRDVGAALNTTVSVEGSDLPSQVRFYRADAALLPAVSAGRQPEGAGEVAAAAKFLARRGLHLGDTVTIDYHGTRATVTVVGAMMGMTAGELALPWSTLTNLDPEALPSEYQVQLGADDERAAFAAALSRVHPELHVGAPRENSSDQAAAIVGGVIALSLILTLISAIGVFNTVLLTVYERRRDLGTLKSIGMTPRQTVALFVTSTAVPGVLGGIAGALLGLAAHRILIPLVTRSGVASFAGDILLAAFGWPGVLPLALAGIVIATVGAALPARRAARMPIAVVLHDE